MNRNKIITIYDNSLKIFVANVDCVRDINFLVNLDLIKKQNYHCGILLNHYTDSSIFNDNLTMPLFSTNNSLDYYTLDIIHAPEKSREKKYRFIFINIYQLAKKGFFTDDDFVIDNFNCKKYDDLIKINNLGNNIPFDNWLSNVLNEGYQMDKVFIVTDKTPFLYINTFPYTFYIKNLLTTLLEYQNPNLIYLSTDNDYYQDIIMYDPNISSNNKSDCLLKNNAKMNLIMVGTLGTPKKAPFIYKHQIYHNFYGKLGYTSNYGHSENSSGYLEIIVSDIKEKILYCYPNKNDIIKYTINHMIRLIQKNKNTGLTVDEINLLENYKSTSIFQNYISYYKMITYSKKSSINIRKWRLLGKIFPEIDKIIEGDLYTM